MTVIMINYSISHLFRELGELLGNSLKRICFSFGCYHVSSDTNDNDNDQLLYQSSGQGIE